MNAVQDHEVFRNKVEQLVCVASGGSVNVDELRCADGILKNVGLGSIGYMNLLESIERTFGIIIDPEQDPKYLVSVDTIVDFVSDQLREAA